MPLVLLGFRVNLVSLDLREALVYQEHQDRQGPLEPLVLLVPQDQRDLQGLTDRKDRLGLPVTQALWVSQDPGVTTGLLEPQELQAHREPQGSLVPQVTLVSRDLRDSRDLLVPRGRTVSQGHRDR